MARSVHGDSLLLSKPVSPSPDCLGASGNLSKLDSVTQIKDLEGTGFLRILFLDIVDGNPKPTVGRSSRRPKSTTVIAFGDLDAPRNVEAEAKPDRTRRWLEDWDFSESGACQWPLQEQR